MKVKGALLLCLGLALSVGSLQNATGSIPVSETTAAKRLGSGRGSAGPQARRHPVSSAIPLAQSAPAGPQ